MFNNIGGVLSAQGDLGPALDAYTEAVESEPGFADGWYNLGNLLLGLSRHAEAEDHLWRALRFAPRHPKVPGKLEQLQAETTKLSQQEFENERKLHELEHTAELCGGDAMCLGVQVEGADTARSSDGPLVI